MAVTISTFETLSMLRPSWLTALARGEALVRMRGAVWKLQVPLHSLYRTAPETREGSVRCGTR
jgi:hypothetical protein